MKKIISLLLLSMIIGTTIFAGGCGKTENPVDTENNETVDNTEDAEKEEVSYTSFDVMYKIFADAGIKPFENTMFLNEEKAQRNLNYNSPSNTDTKEIKIEDFISGVSTQPMMMLATQNVVVLQFSDDKNFEEYQKAMKGIMFSQICVSPDPEKVKIVKNGNFLCYIAADMGDEDYGDALEKAFLNIDFTKAPDYSEVNDAYNRAVQIYLENKDTYEISEITNIMNPAYFLNPKENEEILDDEKITDEATAEEPANEEVTEEATPEELTNEEVTEEATPEELTSEELTEEATPEEPANKEVTGLLQDGLIQIQDDPTKISNEDIADMYLVNTPIDYSSEDKTVSDFGAYVIEVANSEKIDLVKSLVEEGIKTEGNYFEQSSTATCSVEIEGNFVIVTIIK